VEFLCDIHKYNVSYQAYGVAAGEDIFIHTHGNGSALTDHPWWNLCDIHEYNVSYQAYGVAAGEDIFIHMGTDHPWLNQECGWWGWGEIGLK
jgi:hypothetical protein